MTLTEQQRILMDVIDIIFRNVPEDIVRKDMYVELLSVFDDEIVLGAGLGEDDVYDSVFKEFINEEVETDEE